MEILYILSFSVYFVAPAALITGWVRLRRHSAQDGPVPLFSLAGFMLGTVSALLALATIFCASVIGGFHYYDPWLIRGYVLGSLVSLTGVIATLCGIWRRSMVQWPAPVLSFSMLLLWVAWMGSE